MSDAQRAETKTGILQRDVPWTRYGNWMLGYPEKQGWPGQMIVTGALIINGLLGGWILVTDRPDGAFALVLHSVQAGLLLFGLTFLWGAVLLRRAHRLRGRGKTGDTSAHSD